MNSSELNIRPESQSIDSVWGLSLLAAGTIGLTGIIPIIFMSSFELNDKGKVGQVIIIYILKRQNLYINNNIILI